MAFVEAGTDWLGCGISLAGWGISLASLATLGPVGSLTPAILAAAGYSVSTMGLYACFV